MKKIEAKIVADSISPQGHRITSMLLTYPRFIHGELMTHRMFSRNSASSRAIPFEKMVKSVEEDPFIPIAWQKQHTGMQGTEYFTNEEFRIDIGDEFEYKEHIVLATEEFKIRWFEARDKAINIAKSMNNLGLTKQLCNRLLEPFMWHTVLVTTSVTEESLLNFFELRCPKYIFGKNTSKPEIWRSKEDAIKKYPDWKTHNDLFWNTMNYSQAEIHIQALAEAMWDAMNESKPKQLQVGEWHIPFGDYIDEQYLAQAITELYPNWFNHQLSFTENIGIYKIKIATARAARLSYMTFEGEIDYKKDLGLHDKLFINKHKSPFEHCARAMSDEEYFSFIKGKYPTTVDSYGIVNYERYPFVTKEMDCDFIGVNPKNPDIYGWCNNFRGWVPYRYLVENE